MRATASPPASADGSRTRVGLIVPKLGQTAVSRNRLKRRLRELSRIHLLPAELRVDLVIRVRSDAYAATYDELRADVGSALAQLTRWAARVPVQAPVPRPAPPAEPERP